MTELWITYFSYSTLLALLVSRLTNANLACHLKAPNMWLMRRRGCADISVLLPSHFSVAMIYYSFCQGATCGSNELPIRWTEEMHKYHGSQWFYPLFCHWAYVNSLLLNSTMNQLMSSLFPPWIESNGTFVVTTIVCDVESHTWAGFLVNEYMANQRYAYITVYFSQGGKYSDIANSE